VYIIYKKYVQYAHKIAYAGGVIIMAVCEKLEKCPFYTGQMSMETGLGSMYKKKYCEGDKTTCARYMVAETVGKDFVTMDLYPNMVDKAKKIIEDNSK